MKTKSELTDNLKQVESELYTEKINLRCINDKLKIAYQYEDDLNERIIAAKRNTESLRLQFFQKCNDINKKHEEIKKIVDVFTGNFHKDIVV